MELQEIKSRLQAMESELLDRGIAHGAIFGSRARNDARRDSDLDLLLEVKPGSKLTVMGLAGIGRAVSAATGLETNTFLSRSLDDAFRRSIVPDVQQVF